MFASPLVVIYHLHNPLHDITGKKKPFRGSIYLLIELPSCDQTLNYTFEVPIRRNSGVLELV